METDKLERVNNEDSVESRSGRKVDLVCLRRESYGDPDCQSQYPTGVEEGCEWCQSAAPTCDPEWEFAN